MAIKTKKSRSQVDRLIKLALLFAFGIVILALGAKAIISSTEIRSKAASNQCGQVCVQVPVMITKNGRLTATGRTTTQCRNVPCPTAIPKSTPKPPTPVPTCAVRDVGCTVGTSLCAADNTTLVVCQSVYSNTCNKNVRTWVNNPCGSGKKCQVISVGVANCVTPSVSGFCTGSLDYLIFSTDEKRDCVNVQRGVLKYLDNRVCCHIGKGS